MFCETCRKNAQSPILLTFNYKYALNQLQWFKNKSSFLKPRNTVAMNKKQSKKLHIPFPTGINFCLNIIYILLIIVIIIVNHKIENNFK